MTMLLKAIYKFNTIPIKNFNKIHHRIRKKIQKPVRTTKDSESLTERAMLEVILSCSLFIS